LEKIGAEFDASCGFSEKIGFRNGAAFPFFPYNFAEEQAFSFLEFPLCVMDGGLYASARSRETAEEMLRLLMTFSQKFGWGGSSILWHDMALSKTQLPSYIEKLFWQVVDSNTKLISGEEMIDIIRDRYVDAGLARRKAP